MTKSDTNGKFYALLSKTKPNDILIADGGFVSNTKDGGEIHCIKPDRKCKVYSHPTGLYVRCYHGMHFLEGQLDFEDGDSLVGFYPAP